VLFGGVWRAEGQGMLFLVTFYLLGSFLFLRHGRLTITERHFCPIDIGTAGQMTAGRECEQSTLLYRTAPLYKLGRHAVSPQLSRAVHAY
jgi:hypothetical protein